MKQKKNYFLSSLIMLTALCFTNMHAMEKKSKIDIPKIDSDIGALQNIFEYLTFQELVAIRRVNKTFCRFISRTMNQPGRSPLEIRISLDNDHTYDYKKIDSFLHYEVESPIFSLNDLPYEIQSKDNPSEYIIEEQPTKRPLSIILYEINNNLLKTFIDNIKKYNVVSLKIDGYLGSVTDISPIGSLENLKSLKLVSCREITDLSPIDKLKTIEKLVLYNCPEITDIAPIRHLINLKKLKLKYCHRITNLTPVGYLENLKILKVDFCPKITDFTPIDKLKNLVKEEIR